LKGWIRLALAVYDLAQIRKQVGQMHFGFFASPFMVAVEVTKATFKFPQCLTQCHSIPTQFRVPSGRCLAHLATQHALDHLRHEMPPTVSAQTRLRLLQRRSNLCGQFHLIPLSKDKFTTAPLYNLFLGIALAEKSG
jgi:hypothetical protein